VDVWPARSSVCKGPSSGRPTIGLLVNQVISGLNSGYVWSVSDVELAPSTAS
jgi:hypothetical protein